mgnify:CR=1 FL=1
MITWLSVLAWALETGSGKCYDHAGSRETVWLKLIPLHQLAGLWAWLSFVGFSPLEGERVFDGG